MPGTWADVGRQLRWDGAPARADVDRGIEAWAYYQGKLYQAWKADRPQEDRVSLAEASYNAGLGNILKAQAKCSGASLWADIMACLPDVTGILSKETIGYSTRIRRIWRDLEMGG
jgi:membrane-bound lytic murein transglycosylase MltF